MAAAVGRGSPSQFHLSQHEVAGAVENPLQAFDSGSDQVPPPNRSLVGKDNVHPPLQDRANLVGHSASLLVCGDPGEESLPAYNSSFPS